MDGESWMPRSVEKAELGLCFRDPLASAGSVRSSRQKPPCALVGARVLWVAVSRVPVGTFAFTVRAFGVMGTKRRPHHA